MLPKFLLIFPSMIWCIFLGEKSEALNPNFDSESRQYPNNAVPAPAPSQSGYSGQLPAQPSFLIDMLARSLSDGIFQSPVLSNYSTFREDHHPHDLLYRVGRTFLGRAGISDTALPEVAAAAVKKVGYVDSQLFYNAYGYMAGKFFSEAGFLKDERSVTYFALRILGAVDLVACTEGVSDTESMLNSVTGGMFKVFESLGLDTYDNLAELFYLYADGVDETSTEKSW